MVRSLWLRALATTLVWTGVAWAQQPSSAPSGKSAEQILTIQEAGKSPQKCQVVKTFRTSDGHQAYQVRALDTGEMMTITEKSTSNSTYGAKPQSIATQIYHWGRMQVSPPGVPAPAPEKSTGSPFSTAKNPYPSNPTQAKTNSAPAIDLGKTGTNSNSSANKSPTTIAGGAAITKPIPETDWRQSWIKGEEKPLRIDDKLKTKENIAELPDLRIEGKPAAKEIAAERPSAKIDERNLTKEIAKPALTLDQKPAAKQLTTTSKAVLKSDDPLLNPDKYMPKVLDLTPRSKAPESPTAAKSDPKAPRMMPFEPAPARIPTLADVAGAGTATKPSASGAVKTKVDVAASRSAGSQLLPVLPEAAKPNLVPILPTPDKSAVAFDLSKIGGQAPVPNKAGTGQPAVIPAMPTVVEKIPPGSGAGKETGTPTIPLLPVAPEPAVSSSAPDGHVKPVIAGPASNGVGHATVSSAPIIPQVPFSPSVPPAPLPIAAAVVTSSPPAPVPESRAERPSFLVMDPSAGDSSDRAIRLPGVPNAVVAFGQPVTVTAPPPDLVRKKTLEGHTVRVMISQLKESLYPSQRERAAEGLMSANWKVHPQAVEALCAAALEDPAPTVRGRCAESLAAMNVRSETALGVIHKLQADKDETVRSRAEEALKILEPAELPR